jgi:hypothetical protein
LELVRVSATRFFSSRSGGLVASDENLVLDCYRLARWYHVSPEVFLSMPLNDVQLHMWRTNQLLVLMEREAEAAKEA